MRRLPLEYAVRNLGRQPLRTGLGIASAALVALLVVAAGGFVRGMLASLGASGRADNVILLGAGSEESAERSEIDAGVAGIVAAQVRGIREVLAVECTSPEVLLALQAQLPGGHDVRQVVVRGVTHRAFLVHPQVRVVAGRVPEPGRDELMAGSLAAGDADAAGTSLRPGATVTIDDRPWTIVGLFEAPGTVMDAELWAPLQDVLVAARRDTISCVVLGLDDPAAFADVEAFALQRLDLEVVALRETEYYARLARVLAPVRVMVLASALLIALGGLLGGLNTTYAAFAARARELATLQTLGFRRRAIVFALVQESVLMHAAGGLAGTALAAGVLDGLSVRFSMGTFGLQIGPEVAAAGLGASLLLGVVGALPPALRCLRRPIASALRGM